MPLRAHFPRNLLPGALLFVLVQDARAHAPIPPNETTRATAVVSRALTASAESKPSCYPPCRTGFYCHEGKCTSLCNPPCPINQRCTPQGECEPLSSKRAARAAREHYFGVVGGYRPAINDAAFSTGEVRLEFGSKYVAAQIGPAFGKISGSSVTSLRTAFFGQVPFRLHASLPLYLVPTVGLGYTYSWVSDGNDTHLQDIFIVPGLRARYEPISRLAIFVDLIDVEIAFLRLRTDRVTDVHRDDVVPVNWGLTAGVVFLY